MSPQRLSFLCILLFSTSSFASELTILSGTVESFDANTQKIVIVDQYLLQDRRQEFKVEKAELLNDLCVGAKVTVIYDREDVIRKISVQDAKATRAARSSRELPALPPVISSPPEMRDGRPTHDLRFAEHPSVLALRAAAANIGWQIRAAFAEAARARNKHVAVTGRRIGMMTSLARLTEHWSIARMAIPNLTSLPRFGLMPSIPGFPQFPSFASISQMILAKIPEVTPPEIPEMARPNLPSIPEVRGGGNIPTFGVGGMLGGMSGRMGRSRNRGGAAADAVTGTSVSRNPRANRGNAVQSTSNESRPNRDDRRPPARSN